MRILSILLALLLIYTNFCNGVVFETPSGKVRGVQMQSRGGKDFSAFRGIPFAKPPIGDLRFSAPVAAEKWTGVLNATEDAEMCIQKQILFFRYPEVEGSEDCLYINVYTPLRKQNPEKTYPVMVNIFHGGFVMGNSKSTLNGPKFLMDQDIVLITFNYRVGIFGFYSTVDDSACGNWGLKDQVLALKWVQSHVASFGGNPDAVTIFGQSAGGGSVHHHILSPSSSGLFHRAIVQSGSALSFWAKPHNGLQRVVYKKVANAVGCDGEADTKTVIACMRNIDAKRLIEIQDTFKYFQIEPFNMFGMVIEEKTEKNPEPFLTEDPSEIIRKGTFNKVPMIMGVVEDEGMLRSTSLVRQSDTIKELNERFDTLMPMMLALAASVPEQKVPDLWNTIKSYFLGDSNPIHIDNPKSIQGLTDIFSDRFFVYGVYQAAMFHSVKGHQPVWVYRFSYKGEYTFGDVYAATNETIDFDNWGPCHGDELIYLLNSPYLPFGELKGDDLYMSELLVKIWTDFAKFKEPLEGWKPIAPVDATNRSNSLDYLHFTKVANEQTMSNNFFQERMQFWKSLPLNENIPEIA